MEILNPNNPSENEQLDESEAYINRTSIATNVEDDPLDLSNMAKPEEPDTAPAEPEVQTEVTNETVSEEETPPADDETLKRHEEFTSNLSEALEAKTGVNLDGIVEVLTTLLTWHNDILQAESQMGKNTQSVNTTAPNFQRSQARTPLPAATTYDYRMSEILAMSPQDYEKNAQKITNAFMQGRVLKDTK